MTACLAPPSGLKIPVIPDDQSIFGSELYQVWLKIAREVNPFIRCDGSTRDYHAYLQAVQTFARSSIATDLDVHVTSTISLSVPPPHVHEVLFAYSYVAHGRRCYHLTPELAQALQDTDLRWIEAEPFRALPDAFGLHIPPTEGLAVWGDDLWHPVTDIFIERMVDPDRIAFCQENFPHCPPGTQFFSWEAVSRAKAKEGILYRNWGLFPIGEDMKLDTMMKGLEEWGQVTVRNTNSIPESAANSVAISPMEDVTHMAAYAEWSTKEFLRDTKEHFPEHTIGCLASVAYIAKWVLFTASEGFDQAVSRRMPPGFQQKPKSSPKAMAVQKKILASWGQQFRVVLPPAAVLPDDALPSDDDAHGTGTHASPVRHKVKGFFRKQVYGVGRSLRKVIWIQPYWRGRAPFQGPVQVAPGR